jgi:hypothetical protein
MIARFRIMPFGITIFRKTTFRISRQICAGQHGNVVSRENGHSIPGALPLPDRFVPESSQGLHGKSLLLGLELLETNHVRFSFR